MDKNIECSCRFCPVIVKGEKKIQFLGDLLSSPIYHVVTKINELVTRPGLFLEEEYVKG